MIIEAQSLSGLLLLKPELIGDERGYFAETYRHDALTEASGIAFNFVQDNESRSRYGVLRGLHYQKPPYAQTKLVRVTEGRVLDVAVDIRQGSPSFGQTFSVELSSDNKYQLLVPRGFAHGFVVLSEFATLCYRVDNYYAPSHDAGLAFNDPALAIDWQLPAADIILSAKDQRQPGLAQLQSGFAVGNNLYQQAPTL
ncbi:dTDP-4-dehydrorhamnose 3,5-epimerase [Arsukibacterium sp.]|uniref:dTDP-4-dehydrorhamnose 3,5-epimerase n=1 Tax=Arsukibacterium sp. TaxID=1977258 RepID=UPI001BD259F7|nr:dTDP-4-dehydrorhamnose 3,5-epimerase [Arsukibacterium sp.]